MAPKRRIENNRNDRHRNKDHRTPIQTRRIHARRRRESQPNDQKQIVTQRHHVRESAHLAQVEARDVAAVAAGGAGPEGAGVRQGVGGVERDELAADDGVEGDGAAEVDAGQSDGDEAGDVDGVARGVGGFGDLGDEGLVDAAWEREVLDVLLRATRMQEGRGLGRRRPFRGMRRRCSLCSRRRR